MSIRFNCPHCKKVLKVKDELAGKQAKCPACQHVLSIPAAERALADVESLAASVLDDAPKAPPKSATESTTIDFVCMYCDETIKIGLELAGKQAPCPSCRRIVKVPLPKKEEPKDWRKVDPRAPIL